MSECLGFKNSKTCVVGLVDFCLLSQYVRKIYTERDKMQSMVNKKIVTLHVEEHVDTETLLIA